MSDATPRTIYSGKFVAKEKLDKAQAEHAELKAENKHLNTEINTKAEWNMRYFEQIEDLKAELAELQKQRGFHAVVEARSNVLEAELDTFRDASLLLTGKLEDAEAELAALKEAASPFAECLYLDEITSEERAALAVLLLQEKGE